MGASATKVVGSAATSGDKPYQNPITSMEIDLARVDALLDAEDPAFISKVRELREEKIAGDGVDIESESFDDQELELLERRRETEVLPPPSPDGPGLRGLIKGWIRRTKSFFGKLGGTVGNSTGGASVSLLQSVKGILKEGPKAWVQAVLKGFKAGVAGAKYLVGRVKAMPLSTKLGYSAMIALTGLLGFVLTLSVRGRLLPNFEIQFLPTVALEADHAWTIAQNEEWDDFYSPLRHPEHVILLDKVVVNLRKSENSDENPMGYFEFYLELNSRDAAVEAADRKAEISDAIQRTAEAMTYDDIISPAGKTKLKLVIRKNVNNILTQGRVRKVFYKSVVIKP